MSFPPAAHMYAQACPQSRNISSRIVWRQAIFRDWHLHSHLHFVKPSQLLFFPPLWTRLALNGTSTWDLVYLINHNPLQSTRLGNTYQVVADHLQLSRSP
ncbi:hypothetical protein TWF730_010837 [Orbilia blumenaviensis]|uniref:Uncharacterized protein n=1 Tax=Orbilia blumenaviensis TaxID=1796055 RepID=A0AAV9UM57_9PEZI